MLVGHSTILILEVAKDKVVGPEEDVAQLLDGDEVTVGVPKALELQTLELQTVELQSSKLQTLEVR